jgi:NAD-dependent deacetylase
VKSGSTDQHLQHLIKKAAELVREAQYAVALTGAGVSTPSGIPDFRSKDSGLWYDVNPMVVASIYGFRRNPKEFFDWMRPLARLMLEAEPNPAHIALSRLEKLGYIKALITQNIDILHTRAGSSNVFEVHGHIREATCVKCYRLYPTDGFINRYIELGVIPRCPECGGVLKPNVILFGEQLPVQVFQDAQQAAQQCDLMLVAGSSLLVAPVSELPLVASMHGAQVIVINNDRTYIDREASVVIYDDVATVLPRLVDVLEGSKE